MCASPDLHEILRRMCEKQGHDFDALMADATNPLLEEREEPEAPFIPTLDRLLGMMGEHFADCSFDSFSLGGDPVLKSAHEVVKAWAYDFPSPVPPRGLFIIGPVGLGKTHLAAAAAKVVAREGVRVEWQQVGEYLDWLRSNVSGKRQLETMKAYVKNAGLLVLDDLGFERVTDFSVDRMSLLVNAAYLAETPLIVTTNLSVSEISVQLGERVASRLVESTVKVALDGEDWRTRLWRRGPDRQLGMEGVEG